MNDEVCSKCQGTFFIKNPSTGNPTKCSCVMIKEAREYLTDFYSNARFLSTMDTTPFKKKKDVLMEHPISLETYKSIFKSFLVLTQMKFSHKTVSAYEIVQAYLTNKDSFEFTSLSNHVDVVVIYLKSDPSNKSYGEIIKSLIETRRRSGKITWVYSAFKIDSPAFQNAYTPVLASFIKESFLSIA